MEYTLPKTNLLTRDRSNGMVTYSHEEMTKLLEDSKIIIEKNRKDQIEWFKEWVEQQTSDTFTRQQVLNYLSLQ